MDKIDYIRDELKKLYASNPNVHVSIKMTNPKANIKSAPAVIQGVYKCIFQMKENHAGPGRVHTFQYGDVLVGQIVIDELNFVPIDTALKKK